MKPRPASCSQDRLRDAGLRVTTQRVAVLDYLVSTTAHPTAEQIEVAVNRARASVSRASVYNVLHSLRDRGLVREVTAGGALARYDANLAPHHHFRCRGCDRLDDIASGPETPQPSFSGPQQVESFEIVWRGLCAACADAAR